MIATYFYAEVIVTGLVAGCIASAYHSHIKERHGWAASQLFAGVVCFCYLLMLIAEGVKP